MADALLPAPRGGSPLRNRVNPWGEIVADPARGSLMGNRGGCMHDDRQVLINDRWVTNRWISCEVSSADAIARS